jgi:alkylation response protein AidB-like acyl-CoA dehydrogenase
VRFAFTEQQLELRAAVRQVLDRECTVGDLRSVWAEPSPHREGHGAGTPSGADPSVGRSGQRWRTLADLGVPGLLAPEHLGGIGLDQVSLVGVIEEVGRAAVPEPLTETAALAVPLLTAAADLAPEGATARMLVDRLLPRVAAGELVATVGGVDPGVDRPSTATAPAPDVTQGTVATARVVGATRAGLFLFFWEVPGSGWQLHAVESDAVWATRTPSIDGGRDLGTVEWTPWPHTLLASGDHAAALAADLVDHGSTAAAAELVGLADRMVELAAGYARERVQFGKPIGSFQAVKHLLADARVRLEMARPAVYRAAHSLARRDPARAEHAAMAKALASDAADLAARVALQVHGAIGYTWECDLHLFMKRAWTLSAAWGDARLHRARVLAAAVARAGGGDG